MKATDWPNPGLTSAGIYGQVGPLHQGEPAKTQATKGMFESDYFSDAESGQVDMNVEKMVQRILGASYRKGRILRRGIQAGFTLEELFYLIQAAKDVLAGEETLLDLEGPLNIVGDIHGQFTDLLRIFDSLGHPSEGTRYLFLGDYVDRGSNSIETIALLYAYKVMYPDRIFLLRGNHESVEVSRIYGFYDECKRRYSGKLWRMFVHSFRFLPLAAVISDRIFCAHGGLSPNLRRLDDIRSVKRPINIPDEGMVTDILWSDPDKDTQGWQYSSRGISFIFGPDVLDQFLKDNKLDLVCRAHEVVEDGYQFFADRRLVTIFSATNYCGQFDNAGGVLKVQENLLCGLFIIKPIYQINRDSMSSASSSSPSPTNNQMMPTDPLIEEFP